MKESEHDQSLVEPERMEEPAVQENEELKVEEKEEKHEEEESKSLDNEPKEDVIEEKPKIIVQEEPKAKDEAKENEVTKEDKNKDKLLSPKLDTASGAEPVTRSMYGSESDSDSSDSDSSSDDSDSDDNVLCR